MPPSCREHAATEILVVVSSDITKTGPTISGNVVQVIVVKTRILATVRTRVTTGIVTGRMSRCIDEADAGMCKG